MPITELTQTEQNSINGGGGCPYCDGKAIGAAVHDFVSWFFGQDSPMAITNW